MNSILANKPPRLNKKWFNPLYFILNDIIKIPTIRTVLVYGGKSSSKTASIAQLLAKECYTRAASTIAFRKESTIIKTTLKKSFNLGLKTTRLYPLFRTLEFSYQCDSGAEIVLKGLDDPEKAKGIESYKYLCLDELNHFDPAEFQQFNLSLRGIEGQKIFATWNPVSEESWVKKDLVDQYEFIDTEYVLPCPNSFVKISTCGKVVLIKTTYEDNYWISGAPCGTYGYRDENLIAEYEKLKYTDEQAYRVNVLGEWGQIKTGSEFYNNFSETKHVGNYPFIPHLPVHVTYDFNVVPYMTMLCCQYIEEKETIRIRVFREYCLESPLNSVTAVSNAFIDDYEKHLHTVFYYGDASGNNRIAGKGDECNYDDVRDALRRYIDNASDRVSSYNQPVLKRRKLMNLIFSGHAYYGHKRVVFELDSSCKQTIRDLKYLKLGPNGKLKEKVKNEKTGVTYEDIGHTSDAIDYVCTALFEDLM